MMYDAQMAPWWLLVWPWLFGDDDKKAEQRADKRKHDDLMVDVVNDLINSMMFVMEALRELCDEDIISSPVLLRRIDEYTAKAPGSERAADVVHRMRHRILRRQTNAYSDLATLRRPWAATAQNKP